MAITVLFSPNLEVVVTQNDTTGRAGKASGVELAAIISLQILALDASIAGSTQRPIQLMVMVLAVRRVLEHIEFGGREGITASPTDEALLVVASSESTR
jgi:hypothetical protein